MRKKNKLTDNLTRTLLQFVEGKRYEPMTSEELSSQLSIAPAHVPLFHTILSDLVKKGTLAIHRDRITLPRAKKNLVTGVISVHPKGFGFVRVKEGEDIFIPKHVLCQAVDGDTVEVEVSEIVSPKGPEGAVIAVLERSRTHLGCTVIEKRGNTALAHSPLLGKEKPITILKAQELHEGDRVICKVLDWESLEATVTNVLGNISDPSIDISAAIEEFELPDGFTKEALDEARKFGDKIPAQETKNRLDICDQECVTIDPDTAKDFDDAITLTKDKKGHFHLGVHIADVAHYVHPDSELDKSALLRCNSTYFPGTCIPMLPEELSNGLCSLKPKVKRLAMSVFAEFTPQGDLVDYKIARTVIKSAKRFTYKEAFEVIQGVKKSPHKELLDRMVEFCHILKQKRMERGSIDFSMSEDVLIVDDRGMPTGLERVEYDITHQMIEEFMLKANELTAIYLNKQGKTLIYRVHEEPAADSFQDFYSFARSLGFHLPGAPTHRDIQRLFQEAKTSPLLPQLSIHFIRSMRLAQYSPENIGHYGLALEHYCHFTSPIRRYSDLIIQRLLMNELPPNTDLEEIAAKCSEKERLSFKAESSVKLLKKMRLAKTHFDSNPNQTYTATITKTKPFAIFFEVNSFDLEGTLHVSELGSDFYEYNPQRLAFRGKRSGQTFSVGQEITVRLDHLDFILQETKWSMVKKK
jgi:ribonuclease R